MLDPGQGYSLTYHAEKQGRVIREGEIVAARMPDAHGFDDHGVQVAGSPNPLVGPFIVSEARPGDALAVTIHHLYPNRTMGWASKSLHPKLRLTPQAVAAYQKEYVEWEIDLDRWTASPPASFFPGKRIALALHPVLGCLGVAPGCAEASRSIDCGPYGGNMDYPRIAAGVTIYLPVFVEGADLYMGDCHAIQGYGEITGNGIEISAEVTFSVQLVKMNLSQPRGEDHDYRFSIANAFPLERAYQMATNDQLAWLAEDGHLNQEQVGILLGQMVRYENGNLVSNAYTVSCLMPKLPFQAG